MLTSVAARSALAFAVLHAGQVSASLAIAASYFSFAPFPPTGSDSHSSSSNGLPFSPASAALMWHLITVWMYFVSALWTPSSHFPTAVVGGMQPASSPPKGSPGEATADDLKVRIADASSRVNSHRMIVFPPVE